MAGAPERAAEVGQTWPAGDCAAADRGKRAAAEAAAALVEDGMRLGLGSGSTAHRMVEAVARRARDERLALSCVATSQATAALAERNGLRLVDLDAAGGLDLTIDGADEIDPALNLVKGGGGAHLREMIVAAASDWLVIVADASKAVDRLGAFPLPVEVATFGLRTTLAALGRLAEELGAGSGAAVLRGVGAAAFVTDGGNRIADLHLRRIDDPHGLATRLRALPGVVQPGLFLDMADMALIGDPDGSVARRDRGA